MVLEPLENVYFNWLVAKVERYEVPTPSLTHWNLLREMQNTEFVWLVPGDHNRAQDGLGLREHFVIELGEDDIFLEQTAYIGCSVLEMLIAFCYRIPGVVLNPETPREWFWIFMANLDLMRYNDADYHPRDVEEMLKRFVFREYGFSGHGGLFPRERPNIDQRGVELWYQLFGYVQERRDLG